MSERGAYVMPCRSWANVEVVGEHFHEKAILRALGRRPRESEPVEKDLRVQIVPEPDNPYDRNALSVRAGRDVLGYLSREDAKRYRRAVHRLVASGVEVAVEARLWAHLDWEGGIGAYLRVALPEPEHMVPVNDGYPATTSVLPFGSSTYQVAKEEDHFDHLFEYLPRSGEGRVILTMHKLETTLRNGNVRQIIELRLDGERVGELTKVTSAHYLPVVQHADGLGRTVGVWATLKGSGVAAELTINGAKATELSDEWLRDMPIFPHLVPESSSYDVPGAYKRPSAHNSKAKPPMPGRVAAAAMLSSSAGQSETARPAKKRTGTPKPPLHPTPEPLSETITRLGLGDGADRPIFYTVRGKSVHVTDKERSTAGKNPRRTAWIMIASCLFIGLLLGLIPGIGPLLFLAAAAFALIGGVDQLRKAAVLEVDPTGDTHPPMTMARDAQDAEFDQLGAENQDPEGGA